MDKGKAQLQQNYLGQMFASHHCSTRLDIQQITHTVYTTPEKRAQASPPSVLPTAHRDLHTAATNDIRYTF